ncbi:HAMP domain-containing sensor histidine kinase [Nannocystis radixulma]|uniref:histidine kinase n=1 Tax=Nannocystis radixulma TaxID=2995305 RepID=A0ABT5B3Q7_9BACT|nr:HAMP domain-containing sensor histidine kinase [Nannocystis radixulma]MCY1055884.1 HAMP domain-containing sensor histidine kinase [Nannocystis sp. SCPEA4]MDC0668730.1 HAMP domain-containing sensor histidine kinase [Nannocystis radixulma]
MPPGLPPPPAPPLRLRHSLAARITALVVLVVITSAVASLLIIRELRALKVSFDLLTIIYVKFNQDLTTAYRQSVRISTHARERPSSEAQRMSPGTEATLAEALEMRAEQVQQARSVLDSAIAHPERIGGEEAVRTLREFREVLSRLEDLAAAAANQNPAEALADVRTQNEISELFRRLDDQVSRAIIDLQSQVTERERETERTIALLTAATAVMALLAALGVIWTLRPLRRLATSVRQLGEGDWAQRVAAPGALRGDEVGRLALEFNHMAEALQERERRLIRGERLAAVGQLAAQVTHEIRNPLSSVALNVELLDDEIASASPEAQQLLRKITAEIDRLTAITEDYLGLARRKPPERVPTDLAAELHSLLDFMGEELAGAGIEVELDVPGPAWVLGDAGQLRQAFMNLLRNAREALLGRAGAADDVSDLGDLASDLARTPRIAVRLRQGAGVVRVTIEDNGPGLPVADVDKVFEAFFTAKPQGTGLGLSIVQQLVQDHEGSVRVAATGPAGTAFEVQIPACAPPAPSVSSAGVPV